MNIYLVEIKTYAVVMAEDERHAERVATNYRHDALADDSNPQIEVEREVTRLEDLVHGWDGQCIPYGGDGNTRLNALLKDRANVDLWRCTQCGRIGSVGRCCGEETREPVRG